MFVLDLGVAGAAWATTISQTVEMGLILAVQIRAGLVLRTVRARHILALWKLGFRSECSSSSRWGRCAVLAAMVAHLSEREMAAHQNRHPGDRLLVPAGLCLGRVVLRVGGAGNGDAVEELVLPVFRLGLRVVSAYTGVLHTRPR